MVKRNEIILIVIALIIIAGAFGLFSIFQPSQQGFTQYFISQDQLGYVLELTKSQFGQNGENIGVYNTPGASTNWFEQSSVSNTVTIDTGLGVFQFVAEKTGQGSTFGLTGPIGNPNLYGCYQRINVIKNGQQIQQLKSWQESNPDNEDYYQGHTYQVFLDNSQQSWIEVEMALTHSSANNFGVSTAGPTACVFAENHYRIKYGANIFTINISTPTSTFIQGQNVTVNVAITNNLNHVVQSEVKTKFSTPTILGNVILNDVKTISLVPGQNTIAFSLPATTPTGELNIEVEAKIKGDNAMLQNLNFGDGDLTTAACTGTTGSGSCDMWTRYQGAGASPDIGVGDFESLGIIESTSQIVSVSPNPLYLPISNGNCPNNYAVSNNGQYCVRNDVSQLSCFILGCPNIPGTQYECTSAGICAQTIAINNQCTSNSQCVNLTGGLASQCDISSGVCYNEVVYNNFVQCQTPNDCITPCDGITPECIANTCHYSGQCNPQSLDCRDLGCADGFSCKLNQDLGFYGCKEKTFFEKLFDKINPQLFVGVIVLAILIAVFARRFKR